MSSNDIFKYGIRGEDKPKLPQFLKNLLVRRLKVHLVLLLVLLLLAFYIGRAQYSQEELVCNETICPECECEEKDCPEANVCEEPEQIIKEIPTLVYVCQDGTQRSSAAGCNMTEKLEDLDYNKDNANTFEGVTLAIEDVDIESHPDDPSRGYVTEIEYILINEGDSPIIPTIAVYLYETNDTSTAGSFVQKKFIYPNLINPNDYMVQKEETRISFKGKEMTLKLGLIDSLPDPDKRGVKTSYEFTND